MKKFIAIAVMAFVAIAASAQITWNAKLGAGFAKCIGDVDDTSIHIVGKIGIGMEYPLSANWSLMPSAEFALKGAKWEFGEYDAKETLDIYYFQIPVLAAYRMNVNDHLNMVLKAGPYFAAGLYGDNKFESEWGSESDNIFDDGAKRFEVGLDLGVDFEFKRFVVGAEYEFGITPLFKDDKDDVYSIRNSAIYVTLGYKF